MDKFYTKKEIAKECYDELKKIININDYNILLEPSAGNGSFYNLLPIDKRHGIDISPEPNIKEIIKQDYFTYVPNDKLKYIVIGNPPFGKISSLAIKFFNKSAEFCEIIAFILPRTFKRVSIQNKLNLNFHLIYNKDLPLIPCCFKPEMGAKCCFQIWQKKNEKRYIINYENTHSDFTFIKYGPLDKNNQPTVPLNADFAIKAYGANCGGINKNIKNLRPKSWHFIKSNIDAEELIGRFKSLNYELSKDTVRQDSLGKKELIFLYKNKYN